MPLETTKYRSAPSLFVGLFFSIEQVILATSEEKPLNVASQENVT